MNIDVKSSSSRRVPKSAEEKQHTLGHLLLGRPDRDTVGMLERREARSKFSYTYICMYWCIHRNTYASYMCRYTYRGSICVYMCAYMIVCVHAYRLEHSGCWVEHGIWEHKLFRMRLGCDGFGSEFLDLRVGHPKLLLD